MFNDENLNAVMAMLRHAGQKNFKSVNVWESCLCALVLSLEPNCKTYRILEALPYHTAKMDEIGLLNTFAHLGYFARKIDGDMGKLDPRLHPSLFITGNEQPIVILADLGENLQICSKGKIREIAKQEYAGVKGHVCLFEKYSAIKDNTSKFMRNGSNHNWFRALLVRFKGTIAQIMLSGFMLNLIALTTPLFIMVVYDRVIGAGALSVLPMLCLGAALSIGFEWLLRRNRSKGLSWLSARTDNIVSNRIFSHLVGLEPNLIERASVAAQIARIKTFEAVRDFFSGSVFLSMLELPFIALAACAILAIAGPLVFVPLACAVLYLVLFYAIHRKVRVSIRLAAKASSARQQFVIETFEKIQAIKGLGLINQWQSRYRDLSGKEMMSHFQLNWWGMVGETAAHALTLFASVATVAYGVHLVWAGVMTTGALVASMILTWRILTPFYSLCTMIPRLEQLRNSIAQVNDLMDIETENEKSKTRARLPNMKGRVTFSNAELKYADDADAVITQMNLDAREGELVMIVGENGAGKTSLLKMIKGLYYASSGSVQIDGFDVRQLDAQDLRRHIAYVPQHPDFFRGTLVENLRISNPLASLNDIENALIMADGLDDVMSLSEGLDTQIGRYGGAQISSEILYRLSLARAYLHPAPLLLIDEMPNTFFNTRAGKNLKDYLAQNKGRRTTFMVTYRTDFLKLADKIIRLTRDNHPVTTAGEISIKDILKEVA